ncbi:MAG: 5'-methylthioadenosine/adenosylhomocysteine nucleosidase [Firmicutes bacterium]|nr:5'-methylthioadenosine/adenosylhomocysteine nucleosidase [Bacillota bacterium]
MLIGLMCATNDEIALLKKDMKVTSSEEVGGRTFYRGKLYGKNTVLVRSNIGKVAAAITTTVLIERYSVDEIVFTGTAGGVGNGLHVGDAIVAESLVQHDFDCIGCDLFNVPILDKTHFETDKIISKNAMHAAQDYFDNHMREDISEDILRKFHITSPKAVSGVVASGDVFIRSSEKKKWLLDNIDNLKCVEMEGAAAAQVAYEYGVAFAVIRIVSDAADEQGEFNYNEFVSEASSRFVRGIVKCLLS